MPRIFFSLLLSLSSAIAVAGDPASGAASQLGYLDGGGLLGGQDENWKETVDALADLGFEFIGGKGPAPAESVASYLESKGLAVRSVAPLDPAADGQPTAADLIVITETKQPQIIAGLLPLPTHKGLLWADDHAGRLTAWPPGGEEIDVGLLLHAGSALNGPVPDPYPKRIGSSLAEADERGLTGTVLVAAPDFDAFRLNIEAVTAALKDPQGFGHEAFYRDWARRSYGADAADQVVNSLKLLHGAQEQTGGFATVTASCTTLLEKLQNGKPQGTDLNPVMDALRKSRRSLAIAYQAAAQVPDKLGETYKRQIVHPANLYVRGIEALESMAQLGSAWKVYNALPAPMSRQRVESELAEAVAAARELRTALDELPDGAKVPSPAAKDIEALADRLGSEQK